MKGSYGRWELAKGRKNSCNGERKSSKQAATEAGDNIKVKKPLHSLR